MTGNHSLYEGGSHRSHQVDFLYRPAILKGLFVFACFAKGPRSFDFAIDPRLYKRLDLNPQATTKRSWVPLRSRL